MFVSFEAHGYRGRENFDNAVRQLSIIAKLDGDLCVAEGNMLFYNEAYRSADSASISMSSLQSLATTMVTLKHNLLYKHFYQLVVFTLTLPITSASYVRELTARWISSSPQ